jgi:hypothetical protein
MNEKSTGASFLCPSAHPEMAHSRIFGVVGGTVQEPQVAYLEQTLPAGAGMPALAEGVKPIEVFRIAGTCVESSCRHFDGRDCQLVTRIVQILPAVADGLPACRVRWNCRWFAQEGKPACLRCPQVVTQNYSPNEEMVRAATPP